MKKAIAIIVLGLLWCNTGFAECIKGDCNNGYGTYTWSDGSKHVGELKMVKCTDKELSHGQMEKNTLENIKMAKDKDKELTHTQMETNTLENLKMINKADKEPTRGQMEVNTLENIKMVKDTDKGLTHMQMEQLRKVSGKTAN